MSQSRWQLHSEQLVGPSCRTHSEQRPCQFRDLRPLLLSRRISASRQTLQGSLEFPHLQLRGSLPWWRKTRGIRGFWVLRIYSIRHSEPLKVGWLGRKAKLDILWLRNASRAAFPDRWCNQLYLHSGHSCFSSKVHPMLERVSCNDRTTARRI